MIVPPGPQLVGDVWALPSQPRVDHLVGMLTKSDDLGEEYSAMVGSIFRRKNCADRKRMFFEKI